MRGALALLVGPGFGETLPHFPLYLVEALLRRGRRGAGCSRAGRSPFGAVAGLRSAPSALAAEWGWSHVWMPLPWPADAAARGRRRGRDRRRRRRPAWAAASALAARHAAAFPRGARVGVPLAGAAPSSAWSRSASDHGRRRTCTANVALHDVTRRRQPRRRRHRAVDPAEAADDADVADARPRGRAAGSSSTACARRATACTARRADPGLRRLEGDDPPAPTAARSSACRSTCPTTRRSRPRGAGAAASFERAFVRDKQLLQREAKDGVPAG